MEKNWKMLQTRKGKNFFLIVFLVFALGLILGRFTILFSDSLPYVYRKDKTYKILKLIELINRNYVDSVNIDSIVNIVLSDVLNELDPYSLYFTKEQYQSINFQIKGHYKGIGISYDLNFSDTPVIVKVFSNSPAARNGIIPGDIMLQVNGKNLKDLLEDEIVNIFASSQKINLLLLRQSIDSEFTVSLRKTEIYIPTVYTWLTSDSVCYIKIITFSDQTYKQFITAIEKCKKGNIKGIILDLRDNQGGRIDISADILEEFFPSGHLLFYVKAKDKIKEKVFSKKQGSYVNIPLVILINTHTASASELIAGIVQDYDRGVIIGKRSFGKGMIQSVYHFSDGSVARITTYKYYIPSGRSIQRSYNNDMYFIDFEDDSARIIQDTTKVYFTKNGRKVLEGSGIVPDIKINDTLFINSMIGKMFSIKILARYGTQINKMQTIQEIENFVDTSFNKSYLHPHIFSIKYNLIESHFGQDSAYKYFNKFSPVYHKALEVILDRNKYNRILSNPIENER